VVVRDRREVHDHGIRLAHVPVGVPYAGRDVHQPATVVGEEDTGAQSLRGRLHTIVIERDLQLAEHEEVAVLVPLVHPPALRLAGPDRERVGEHERIRVPVPALVEHLEDGAAIVHVCRHVTEGDARRHRREPLTVRRDGLHVLNWASHRCGPYQR
jgi:hypothetical protein